MPFPSVMILSWVTLSQLENLDPPYFDARLFTEELTWVMRMWFLKLQFFVESPFLFSENKRTVGTSKQALYNWTFHFGCQMVLLQRVNSPSLMCGLRKAPLGMCMVNVGKYTIHGSYG